MSSDAIDVLVDAFSLAGNLAALLALGAFVSNYGRVKFGRTVLGITIMSAALATALLAGSAALRRVAVAAGWGWADGWWTRLLVGVAWFAIAACYGWNTRYFRKVQREERS